MLQVFNELRQCTLYGLRVSVVTHCNLAPKSIRRDFLVALLHGAGARLRMLHGIIEFVAICAGHAESTTRHDIFSEISTLIKPCLNFFIENFPRDSEMAGSPKAVEFHKLCRHFALFLSVFDMRERK